MKYRLLLLCMLVYSNIAGATDNVRPFVSGSLEKILSERAEKPFVLIIWSLTCAYCPTVMKLMSVYQQSHSDLDIVLIATDTPDEAPQLIKRVSGYGFDHAEQWVFSDDVPERLRYEIDSRWYGEIPRTQFYDSKHQYKIKVGLISPQFIENWIAENSIVKK